MKKIRSALAYVLLLAMLLSSMGGFAFGAGENIVSVGEQLAFDPLAETQSVAYERHTDGYEVTLDRAADSVTMRVTAVPKTVSAEGAALYIRTGVAPKAGKTYRVSYTLTSEQALDEYAVCFDGTEENAYRAAENRSVTAGGTDLARCFLTPEAESGELILRLQLGKTPVNTLRFSGLTVEEATEEEVAAGANTVLVDKLNYNAPGLIRLWTNDDCGATLTSDGSSSTLTVTEVPRSGAEVWKIKLLVATGLMPEAGKAYRFRADIVSSASAKYEVCYNEGETEKGYDVLYNQNLSRGKQTIERTVYVTRDKEDPGELIVQLSLGLLRVDDKVTISNVRLEEASATYTDVLPKGFAYDKTEKYETFDPTQIIVSSTTPVATTISYVGDASATATGDRAGSVLVSGGSATVTVEPTNNPAHNKPWGTRFNLVTGAELESDTIYKVSFQIRADKAYSNYEVKYGSGFANDFDGKTDYGELKPLTLSANTPTTVEKIFKTETAGGLLLQLLVGETDAAGNLVEVSGIQIQKMTEGTISGTSIASVTYPSSTGASLGNFSVRANVPFGGTITGDGSSATMTCTGGDAGEGNMWKRGMFTGNIASLSAGKSYQVSFSLSADQNTAIEVCYNKNDEWGSDEKAYGWKGGLTASATPITVTHIVTALENSGLRLRLDMGRAAEGAKVTVSNIQVKEITSVTPDGTNIASATYPTSSESLGNFSVRANVPFGGTITGDGSSATMTCTGGDAGEENMWKRGMFTGNIASLIAGKSYQVSFSLSADQNTAIEVCYNKNDEWGSDEKAYGWKGGLTASATPITVTHIVTALENSGLRLRLDMGRAAEGAKVTVSNIQVKEITSVTTDETGSANPVYPSDGGNPGDFTVGATGSYTGTITPGTPGGALLTCTGGSTDDVWKRKLFVNSVCNLTAGTEYEVSVDVKATADTDYEICYNKDDIEKGLGAKYGLTATSAGATVTYRALASADGALTLQFNLGKAATDAGVTVSGISVKTVPLNPSGEPISVSFSSLSTETYEGFTAALTKNSDSAQVVIDKHNADPATWRAKLCVRTGAVYEAGKSYRFSFDIEADNAQAEFCVITKGVSDSADIRGTWGLSLAAGQKKTVTTRTIPAGWGSGALGFDIELGKLNEGSSSNTYTISNIKIEEVYGSSAPKEYRTIGTIYADFEPGYTVNTLRSKDSGGVNLAATPTEEMEPWKVKLFVDTEAQMGEGQWYRVCMDVTADKDMDYEVCYNRDGTEKGFDALYGLHADGGKTQTVEKVFCASGSGKLKIQLSLGSVPAPNTVTVNGVRVEQVSFRYSGQSAMPAEPVYGEQSAVSYWAHADYTTELTGTDDAITMHILKAPGFGAEPWKIKLFLDTATPLEPGKFYRITTDLVAKSPQNVEICYNSGGVEMGYDSMGGIRLAAGVKQTVEKLISVPADKTDGKNLMLQVNLGAATSPNEITVSGVTVEEVSLRYADLMPQSFSYQKHSTVRTSPDIDAKLETTTGTASICITDAPATGAEVWMAQLLVRTGVVLTAGKSYVVRANLVSDKNLTYELCFNNEETEKGFDVLYGQFAHANTAETIDKKISVPAGMTDAGELVLQFSVGGPGANNVTVANVSVQELRYGTNGAKDLTPAAAVEQQGALDLHVSREAVTGRVNGRDGAIRVTGAALCAGEQYEAAFTGKADAALSGTLTLRRAGAAEPVMTQRFTLSPEAQAFAFTTGQALDEDGAYELLWQFEGSGTAELSDITLSIPAEELIVKHVDQKVTVNGAEAAPDVYEINGENYFRLRDLAMLLNDTLAQFVVRYNSQNKTVSVTTGKRYSPVGGELERGADRSASCARGTRSLLVDGKAVSLKAYNLGSNNYFRLADLDDTLGFRTDYIEAADIVAITSPLTPEAQEASYAYGTFFRPEIDSESQPYVGDPMAYYEDGVYYIYYLKEGGDSVNHSVYLTTTSDFASYTEIDKPVLAASRGDAQDSWIGTGSVTKVDGTYYFFYTGYNSSGAREYHEKIMVAKGSSPTSFEKVSGWEITPPASLGQKNDFRDPQAYYDPATGKISLTVTASQGGVARILKYTLNKDLTNAQYDGIIFTDPSGKYWNLECSDTFRLGDKWYLTYSGQEDTLWYAAADSRFGPYSAPIQLDGKVFYAAKHVEDGKNSYMVGWARRSETASSTQEVAAWGGNLAVQKLTQRADGSLALAPVDSVAASFSKPAAVTAESISLSAGSDYSFKQVCTSAESFKLTGEFACNGTGAFGLAFDFNGKEESYKLISVDPKERTLRLAFNEGVTKIAETPAELGTKHSFTYIQDGSVGIFYVDGVASLTVRVYGSTGKPVYLFAQGGSVSFTSLRCFAK